MRDYEGRVCRQAAHVIAVSDIDAKRFRDMFGVTEVSVVPTGVDVGYFSPPTETIRPAANLVFTGSMDWLPNIDGAEWFVTEVFPIIRAHRPDCGLVLAGRNPDPRVMALSHVAGVHATGTVSDIRPFLWGSSVSIVPLRIGGGTRLKIYEAMAARVPVVSTTVGAEGLTYHPGVDIEIADDPQGFADACLRLVEAPERRRAMAEAAWNMVKQEVSWESVSVRFEEVLSRCMQDAR